VTSRLEADMPCAELEVLYPPRRCMRNALLLFGGQPAVPEHTQLHP
jgi:hypothetical protein